MIQNDSYSNVSICGRVMTRTKGISVRIMIRTEGYSGRVMIRTEGMSVGVMRILIQLVGSGLVERANVK